MRLLLDTHVLLWQLDSANAKLGPQTIKLVKEAEAVCVSSISVVEMQIKTMLGKFNAPLECEQMILEAGNTLMNFSASAADNIRKFATLARHDPFDRMLLAQADANGLAFLTGDAALLALNLEFVIDARL